MKIGAIDVAADMCQLQLTIVDECVQFDGLQLRGIDGIEKPDDAIDRRERFLVARQ